MKKNTVIKFMSILTVYIILSIYSNVYADTVSIGNDWVTLKQYLEAKDVYHTINLTDEVFVGDHIMTYGNKTINGNGHGIHNHRNFTGNLDATNHIFTVMQNSTLTLNNVTLNGNAGNMTTESSTNIGVNGILNVNNSSFINGGEQGIHVGNGGILYFNSGTVSASGSNVGIGSAGTVYVGDGSIAGRTQGLHNNHGTLNLKGGTVTGADYAIVSFNSGTANIMAGNIYGARHGVLNRGGTINISGGNIHDNSANGVLTEAGNKTNISGGNIYNNGNGVYNEGTTDIWGGNIYDNKMGVYNTSVLYISGPVSIKDNTDSQAGGVYHNGSLCSITSGTFGTSPMQHVYLAANDKFVSTNSSTPTFRVYPNAYTRGRKVVQTSANSYASELIDTYVTLYPNDGWHLRTIGSEIDLWDTGTVTATYKSSSGTVLKDPIVQSGWGGDSYTTTAPESIGLYKLKTTPSNASGSYNDSNIFVNYVYEQEKGKIIVKYIDKYTGEEVSPQIESIGDLGDSYTAEPSIIDGYAIEESTESIEKTYSTNDQTITFYYIKQSELRIKYVDLLNENNRLRDDIVVKLKQGESYKVQAEDILGYKLIEKPENEIITIERENITITYGYKKISKVVVKHQNEDGTDLVKPEIIDGNVGDKYTTLSKEFDNYELKETPENANGEITEEQIEVIYVYSLIKGKIVITKVDKNDSSKLLSGAMFKIEKLTEEGILDDTFIAQEKTTGDNGKTEFTDLTVGKYRVTETKAPDGYELKSTPIDVEISKYTKDRNVIVTDRIKLQLPETGGNGAIIFIVIGSIAFLILLVLRKYELNKIK